jgi:3-oxoacyl-[acyl-carrier-protein] synthase II
MTQQVWITGVGAATPLGHDFATFAENLLAGKSGVASQPLFRDDPGGRKNIAAIGPIPVPPGWDEAAFGRYNRLEQLSLSCSARALQDAGLASERGALRIGVVLGLGAEHLRVWELDTLSGGTRVYAPEQDVTSVTQFIHRELRLNGPAVSTAAACASGGYALGLARRWIQLGWVDVCLAGGCDLITPMSYGGFYNLRALSRRDDAPTAASRPFDRARDGFVMGEGGSVFVLESDASARRRNAHRHAEFAGFGASSDASHMVIPSSEPGPASRAVRAALADAGVNPEELDYVNAHAAGTPVGDRAESRVLQLALGTAVTRVPVSSTKSMTGHLLSGAAAVEALACLVAIRDQALPPTINLDDPDPECDLLHVPHHARPAPVRVAASNSLGFGGSNTCLVLRKAA